MNNDYVKRLLYIGDDFRTYVVEYVPLDFAELLSIQIVVPTCSPKSEHSKPTYKDKTPFYFDYLPWHNSGLF